MNTLVGSLFAASSVRLVVGSLVACLVFGSIGWCGESEDSIHPRDGRMARQVKRRRGLRRGAAPGKACLPDPAVEELKQQMAVLRSELEDQRETNRRLSESVQVMSARLSMLTTATAQTVRRNELERTVDQIKAQSATLGPVGLKVTVGGQYRVMGDQSNFSWHDATIPAPGAAMTPTRNAFSNLRLRNNLDVRVDERHGGFLQYEVGHVSLGANAEFPKAAGNSSNPDMQPGDIELRRAFLYDDRGGKGTYRVGILDFTDPYGSILASADWDFNVGGVDFYKKLGHDDPFELRLGAYQLFEHNHRISDDTALYAFDLNYVHDAKRSIGLGYHVMDDSGSYSYAHLNTHSKTYLSSHDYWLGLHGTTSIGDVALRGAFIHNEGSRLDVGPGRWTHSGDAVRVEAVTPVGRKSTLSVQGMHTSGEADPNTRNSGEFRTIAQSAGDNFGAASYWGYLSITSPHGPSDINDLGVSSQNRGLGLNTLQGKLDVSFNRKLAGTLAAGWLTADKTNPANGGKEIGTEGRAELAWTLGKGFEIQSGIAHLWTGSFYKTGPTAGDPENLYQLYTRTQLEF